MEVKPVRSSNAPFPMLVTLAGMMVFSHPATSVLVAVAMMALQFSRESYTLLPSATSMEVRLLQLPEKA